MENKVHQDQLTSVSIIIATRNRASHLKQTLDAIADLRVLDNFRVELIVVDNGSTDETADVVSSAVSSNISLVYLQEKRLGQTYARNAGMNAAKSTIFLWTDDDVRPPLDWIEQMCLPIAKGEAMGVSGKIRTAPHLERLWMTRTHYDRLSDTRFMPEDFGSMIGANMAFHRDVLQRIDGFDTELGPGKLGFMDDSLFSFRMQEEGFKIVALPQVTVEHHFEPSRLLRRSWLQHGETAGRSIAFVHHHWDHKKVKFPWVQLVI